MKLHPYSMKPVEWLPQYSLLRLFTESECKLIREQIDQSGILYEAERLADDGTTYVDKSYRNCHTGHLHPGDALYDLLAKRIFERLTPINRQYEFDLFPEMERLLPVINLNRYDGDDEAPGRIALHPDMGPFEGAVDRKLSMSILLNDPKEYEGGRFRMFDGGNKWPLDDAPVGTAVIFPSYQLHAVDPVIRGSRYTAVVWLRGPRLR
jgi:hypothetical protein